MSYCCCAGPDPWPVLDQHINHLVNKSKMNNNMFVSDCSVRHMCNNQEEGKYQRPVVPPRRITTREKFQVHCRPHFRRFHSRNATNTYADVRTSSTIGNIKGSNKSGRWNEISHKYTISANVFIFFLFFLLLSLSPLQPTRRRRKRLSFFGGFHSSSPLLLSFKTTGCSK